MVILTSLAASVTVYQGAWVLKSSKTSDLQRAPGFYESR